MSDQQTGQHLINRRGFLVGSAAAAVATAVGLPNLPAPPIVYGQSRLGWPVVVESLTFKRELIDISRPTDFYRRIAPGLTTCTVEGRALSDEGFGWFLDMMEGQPVRWSFGIPQSGRGGHARATLSSDFRLAEFTPFCDPAGPNPDVMASFTLLSEGETLFEVATDVDDVSPLVVIDGGRLLAPEHG